MVINSMYAVGIVVGKIGYINIVVLQQVGRKYVLQVGVLIWVLVFNGDEKNHGEGPFRFSDFFIIAVGVLDKRTPVFYVVDIVGQYSYAAPKNQAVFLVGRDVYFFFVGNGDEL